MACYHPIPAYQGGPGEDVRLWPPVGTATLNIPCGTCLGCRTDAAADWARRAQHEASLWEHNCFLTLTYSDAELPSDGQLEPNALRAFIKRLRKAHSAKRKKRPRATDRSRGRFLDCDPNHSLRYLAAGEYGETNGRPHYHLCLFNCGFNDAYQVGKDLLESPVLQQLWTAGQHRLGALTGASANYVAQYTLKKLASGEHYISQDGVLLPRPFMRASLRPAIGHTWLHKHKNDLAHGYLVTDGHKSRIPRSYLKKLSKTESDDFTDTIQARASRQPRRHDNLQAKEHIHQQHIASNHHRTL